MPPTPASRPSLSGKDWLFDHYRALSPDRADHIRRLPFRRGDQVLDVGAGPGYFATVIAEMVGDSGEITCLEPDDENAETIKKLKSVSPNGSILHPVKETLEKFPATTKYDVVFISHVFSIHQDPLRALERLFSFVRPGGYLIILELESGSQILNPIELELWGRLMLARLQNAQYLRNTEANGFRGKDLFSHINVEGIAERFIVPHAVHVGAPLSPAQHRYIDRIMPSIAEEARPYAAAEDIRRFKSLFDPHAEEYILNRPEFFYAQTRFAFVFRLSDSVHV